MSERSAASLRLAADLAARVLSALDVGAGRRAVIGVAGESGSGKSITAVEQARHVTAAGIATIVLHQDDYFLRPPRTNHQHRVRDLASVGPHEVDLARLGAHVAAFRDGVDAVGPSADHAADRFVTRPLALAAARVLVVEGTYALSLPDLDFRVFLEATHEETRTRRLARNRDVDAPIVDTILAIEHELIAPQRRLADVVVDRDFRIVTP